MKVIQATGSVLAAFFICISMLVVGSILALIWHFIWAISVGACVVGFVAYGIYEYWERPKPSK